MKSQNRKDGQTIEFKQISHAYVYCFKSLIEQLVGCSLVDSQLWSYLLVWRTEGSILICRDALSSFVHVSYLIHAMCLFCLTGPKLRAVGLRKSALRLDGTRACMCVTGQLPRRTALTRRGRERNPSFWAYDTPGLGQRGGVKFSTFEHQRGNSVFKAGNLGDRSFTRMEIWLLYASVS